jgi:hypothetical protein
LVWVGADVLVGVGVLVGDGVLVGVVVSVVVAVAVGVSVSVGVAEGVSEFVSVRVQVGSGGVLDGVKEGKGVAKIGVTGVFVLVGMVVIVGVGVGRDFRFMVTRPAQ